MENGEYGPKWRMANSWFIIFVFFLGLTSGIPFLVMGMRTKLKKWICYGFIYFIPLISATMFSENIPEIIKSILMSVWFILWIISIIHVFIAKKEYLLRLQAIQSHEKISDAEKIESYKKQYARLDEKEQEELIGMEEETMSDVEMKNEADGPTDSTKELHFDEYRDEINPVNINTATLDEIAQLPGIGNVSAKMIILMRSQNGKFTSIEQIGESLGLSLYIIEKLRPYVTF